MPKQIKSAHATKRVIAALIVSALAAGFMWSIADFCARLKQVRSGFEWRFAQQGESANIDYYAPYDRSAMAIERLRGDTAFLPRYRSSIRPSS